MSEYVALTQLQADAFVTLDAELARSVEGIVATRRLTRCARRAGPAVDVGRTGQTTAVLAIWYLCGL
jgi:hypothetical protein